MRQVLICALLVAAAFAATNCSVVTQPSATANYYMPPKACVDFDNSVRSCYTAHDTCIKATGADCRRVETCFSAKMRCLEGVNPTNANCTTWASGLENFGLYLIAGGSYKDSSLHHACEWAVCRAASEAFTAGIKAANGNICPVNLTTVCVAPNFEQPTRAPNQPKFSLTFGGSHWVTLLQSAPKGSPKYRQLEGACAKGLAKLLNILEHLITILDMRSASLFVDFIVNDPTVTVDQVKAKLDSAVADPTVAAAAFAELATESGAAITVTGAGVEDFSTPAPGTPAPTMAASMPAALVAAVLAVLATLAF